MSWFGGGKKKDADDGPAEVVDSSGGFDNASFTPSSPATSFDSSGPSAGAAPAAAGGAAAKMGPREQAAMQQQILAMQEQAVVGQLVSKLTYLAFDQCVAKPTDSLRASEKACINSVVMKFIDTGSLIAGPQRQGQME